MDAMGLNNWGNIVLLNVYYSVEILAQDDVRDLRRILQEIVRGLPEDEVGRCAGFGSIL